MFDNQQIQVLVGIAAAAGLTLSAAGCSQSADQTTESPEQGPSLEVDPSTGTQEVNVPPVADFEIEADLPENGDPVSFDASATKDPNGDELTYSWRFGDQTPGGGQKISHIYADGGDFEVTLTVADEDGATDSVTKTVSIKDTPFGSGRAEVTIIVRDLEFHDMNGVEISPVGSDITKTTGQDGKVTFEEMPTGKPLVFEATKDGYAKQITRIRLPDSATSAPVLIRMQPVGAVVEVEDIQKGGEVHGYDGARLEFPPEAVVDSEGNPVTGDIEVEFTTFDVSDTPEIDGFPGAFLGLRPDGDIEPILSFGAMEVNLNKNGEELQIKPGKSVEMDIPAYAEGVPMEADIPVWSLDESTGIWVDEGDMEPVESEASPTNRVLRTEVTHFTSWNGDYPLTTPCKMKPKCKIVDPDTGKADAPLKTGQNCQVKVTSGKLRGLGTNCRTPEAAVSGRQCSSNSDCATCNAPGTNVAGTTCSSDSDCKVCENASSSVDSANGEACTSDSDCNYEAQDGSECSHDGSSCSEDSDCFIGECTGGDASINGTSCESDSDCSYSNDVCSHDGSSCSSEADCYSCKYDSSASCTSDSDCPGGNKGSCYDGGTDTGNDCYTDSDCPTGGATCKNAEAPTCVTSCKYDPSTSCTSDSACPGGDKGSCWEGGSKTGNKCYTDSDCPTGGATCKNAEPPTCTTSRSCDTVSGTGTCDKDQSPTCDKSYITKFGDCNAKSCEVPDGITCNTSTLPGGQTIPGGGVCKDNSQCPGVQFCSSSASSGAANGQCALPGSGGVFAGATGRFNETFMVDAKGNYVSGPYNPEADQGWLWVPNTNLQLRGRARGGKLHGATNVAGFNEANKDFKDGTARKCKVARPIIPLRHECGSGIPGLKGKCPEIRRKHFCEMLFKCPESAYSRSFTKTLGTPNIQECIDKFENDFDIPLIEKSIRSDRATFNGHRSGFCLDKVAALRTAINRANASGDKARQRQVCAQFDRLALKQTACTGVEGKVGEDQPCVHDLECKDLSEKVTRSCERSTDSACLGTCKTDIAAERRCGDSHICNYGQYCKHGNCYAKRTRIGATCDATNQCGAGLYCNLNAGECQRRQFVKSPGDACSRQTSCALGLQCMISASSQVCREFSEPGGSCVGNTGGGTAGCMWDAFCDGSSCVAKKDHGADCSADHECMSGACKRSSPGSTGTCFGPHKAMSCP